jgi:hypothetical protein
MNYVIFILWLIPVAILLIGGVMFMLGEDADYELRTHQNPTTVGSPVVEGFTPNSYTTEGEPTVPPNLPANPSASIRSEIHIEAQRHSSVISDSPGRSL